LNPRDTTIRLQWSVMALSDAWAGGREQPDRHESIDSGRIYASMRFHIDTRDAIAHDDASRLGLENEVSAGGSFGQGPWGASASVRNNVSYVSTQRNQSTSEMNTDLELNSAVEINFKSDYLPLNKLATPNQAAAIKANSRNPEADGDAAREKRIADARTAEGKRSDSLTGLLAPTRQPPQASPGTTNARPADAAPRAGTPAPGPTTLAPGPTTPASGAARPAPGAATPAPGPSGSGPTNVPAQGGAPAQPRAEGGGSGGGARPSGGSSPPSASQPAGGGQPAPSGSATPRLRPPPG
jgi:hypothetical protein